MMIDKSWKCEVLDSGFLIITTTSWGEKKRAEETALGVVENLLRFLDLRGYKLIKEDVSHD